MPRIEFDGVELTYPVRENQNFTLKELIFHGILRQKRRKVWKTVAGLRGVSLTVEDHERVGIIGFNGAGKSTLLRVIAGVYPTSAGRRLVEGRISSIFDIGLGFEFAATGWENIRYRAYLLGETPRTIQSKLDDIAEFTALGDFLDLPLNCYSTGMVLRLAFAIATSSEPEILLIDEVFGTGDVVFQRKAEQRMHGLLNKAKIVVMVGHNVDYLASFCNRMIWMHQGQIRMDGAPAEVVAAYKGEAEQQRNARESQRVVATAA